ncbi:MAG: molybdopterin-dependent oxidoreductase, partial [Chloroflexi bacterium]|nr:molybdopterin-dependent oxidoreductase [Chloroflexota bacterium]
IIEGKMRGAKVAVIDPRLSNTASMSDYWLPTWPGSETAVILAMAKIILDEDLYDREFVRRWVNWEQYLQDQRPTDDVTFDNFVAALKQVYAQFTPEYAEAESGLDRTQIVEVAHEIARAGSAFSTHIWRSAASGNLWGWEIARALMLLSVLTGSVGTPGGTAPNAWDKFVPLPFRKPPPQKVWNELLWPREYPLAHHELSYLLPHFLKEGRGKLDVYFTRVYNPLWTNPDGFTWLEVLKDESKIGLHASLTPTWCETAWFADYILPMGHGPERHDTLSYETHSSKWLGFRQPVLRVARERNGQPVEFTYETNPGEVWEEAEFWIELSWRIDHDGSLGIRQFYESPYRPGEKVTVTEWYQYMFENSVPGLPQKAAEEGLTPLGYMQKYGAFEVGQKIYREYEKPVPTDVAAAISVDPATKRYLGASPSGNSADGSEVAVDPATQIVKKGGAPVGVLVDGEAKVGFPTPSRKLEFYSRTLVDWKWSEHAIPSYHPSHVSRQNVDRSKSEYLLLPTFRLPTLIHTRSGNAKFLNEISHTNPLWVSPEDAELLGVGLGDLLRVTTEIGYFVNRVWITEGIMPGIVACSHHLGRWRLRQDTGGERWSTALVELQETGPGKMMLRQIEGTTPFRSEDPDSSRIWWSDAGVHQNLTFPVHPDPVSGMHCWHQKVTLSRAAPDDRYGDVFVDTEKSMSVYRHWLSLTRPAPGPDGLRRPLWLLRPFKPAPEAFKIPDLVTT